MSDSKGNVVFAGDKVFAGIDEDDQCEVSHSIAIEFPDSVSMGKALRSGMAEFTVFNID